MKALIFILALTMSWTDLSADDDKSKSHQMLPEYWHNYILTEQLHQPMERINQIYGPEIRTTITFHEYWVPADNTEVVASSDLNLLEESVTKNKVRILVPAESTLSYVEHSYYQSLVAELGEPFRKWIGYRMQGHSSYMIWPKGQDQKNLPLFIKVESPQKLPTKKSVVIDGVVTAKEEFAVSNGYKAAQEAVGIDSFINKVSRENPSLNLKFWAEPLAVTYYGRKESFTFSMRTLPERKHWDQEGLLLLPLHGFLGSPWPAKFARSANLEEYEWYNEYAKELAKYFVHLNFKAGIWPAAHTQNLTIVIDTKKNKIKDFIFKDLSDTLVSPLILALNDIGTLIPADSAVKILSKDWLEGTSAQLNPASYHLDYSSSSLTGFFKADNWRLTSLYTFFDTMMKEFNIDPSRLTPKVKLILDRIKSGQYQSLTITYGQKTHTGTDAAYFILFEEIYKLALQDMLIKKLKSMDAELVVTQAQLKELFDKSLAERHIQWAWSDSRSHYSKRSKQNAVKYLVTKQGVLAYDAKTFSPIGIELSQTLTAASPCVSALYRAN